MKKIWWLITLLLLPIAYAQGPGEVLSGVFTKILSLGNLSFIGVSGLPAFTRILIWILTFTLFFAASSVLPERRDGTPFFKRNHAMVISAVLATISAIFLPVQAVLAVGAGWSTAVALLLIGAPIVGFGYLLWKVPGKGKETKFTVLIKLLISLILFWILSAMKNELVGRGVIEVQPIVGNMASFIAWALYIVSTMIIWYIIKIFWVSTPEEKAKQEQEYGEKGAKMREWIGQQWKEKEAEEQMERKRDLTSPVRNEVVKAMDALSEVENNLNDLKGMKAKKYVKEVQEHLKKAIRGSHLLLRGFEGADRDKVVDIINFLQTAQKGFLEDVKDKIPETIHHRAEIKEILGKFENLRGSLGNVYKQLELLHTPAK